ncbi:MAG: hypothetical protein EOO68_15265 [Moraxellaceae bacterium]|nr:MAG: hypothetical protein EOO68_15265 [Moraxellaceae bacterium]
MVTPLQLGAGLEYAVEPQRRADLQQMACYLTTGYPATDYSIAGYLALAPLTTKSVRSVELV